MMFNRYVLIAVTFIAAILSLAIYTNINRIVYSCSGEYVMNIYFADAEVRSQINVTASVTRAQKLYVNYNGSVNYNGGKYHLSRDIGFLYNVVNKESGLVRIYPIYDKRSASDTLSDEKVESLLLGEDKQGRLIRVWKLSNAVILVGNPYAPVFSCVMLGGNKH